MIDYLSIDDRNGTQVFLHGDATRALASVDGLVGLPGIREVVRPRPNGHGSLGRTRTKLGTAKEITELLANPILDDLPFKSGDSVLAFINGMGGTPLIELYVVYNELAKICAGRGVKIARNLVGSYITSLEMSGCSITLLKVDDELIRLWDAPVKTPALRWGV